MENCQPKSDERILNYLLQTSHITRYFKAEAKTDRLLRENEFGNIYVERRGRENKSLMKMKIKSFIIEA